MVQKIKLSKNLQFSDRRCKFPTEEITDAQSSIMLLNFPQTEVFSYKCSILDDNFLTIIKVDFSDNFPTAKNLARQIFCISKF